MLSSLLGDLEGGPAPTWRALVWLVQALLVAGCGPGEGLPGTGLPAAPATCAPGEMLVESGGCQPAGLPPDMQCAPGELPLDNGGCQPAGLPPDMPCPPGELPLAGGGCQPAGVPPDACGQGFEPDGQGGCNAILPPDPCPPGKMAIPGETQCRDVAPCGTGDYGLIPLDVTTQFVNAAYPGSDSDGTQAKPWKKIQHGINQAKVDGAIVAVAAGTYVEDLLIQSRPIRLWGRCPAMVEVVGTGADVATLEILTWQASQSEVHSIAITGPRVGIGTSGASDVVIDHVWIHDTMKAGFYADVQLGPTNTTIRASLIEATKDMGVIAIGSDTTIEATVVRATQPLSDPTFGVGVAIQGDAAAQHRATLMLRTSLLEQNHADGVAVDGSDATVEATVVRATQPLSDGTLGRGIHVQSNPTMQERSTLILRSSLLEQNHDVGLSVLGSDATVEATVVRATQPLSDGTWGRGVEVQADPYTHERSTLTLRSSLLEQNHEIGLFVSGSDATVEATVVRATQSLSDGTSGRGINVQFDPYTHERSIFTLRTSLLEQNHEIGLFASGSDATVEATVVRTNSGTGINVQFDSDTHERSTLLLHTSLVEQNHGAGVVVFGSDATVEATVVHATQPLSDGTFGRGIDIEADPDTHDRSTLMLRTSLLEQNHDASLFVLASDATVEATVVRGTQPLSDGTLGRGIEVQADSDTHERSTLLLHTSLVEQNHGAGVLVFGSDATVEATVVRATQPLSDGRWGRGIEVGFDPYTHERSILMLRTSLVEQNHSAGLFVLGSDATIEATVVRGNQARGDGAAGDGIMVDSVVMPIRVFITSSQIESNARAGISNFRSQVILISSRVQCHKYDLNGEDIVPGKPFTFDGSKDNLCGCADKPDPTCPVRSANLSPPEPILPVEPSP